MESRDLTPKARIRNAALLAFLCLNPHAQAAIPSVVTLAEIEEGGATYDGEKVSIAACAHVSKHAMALSPCGGRKPMLLLAGNSSAVLDAYTSAQQSFDTPLQATFIGVFRLRYEYRGLGERVVKALLVESVVNPKFPKSH